MLNIGTTHQAQHIPRGHIVTDVWGQKVEVFSVTITFATVIFNDTQRPVVVGAEDPMTVVGHFNL